MPNGTSRSRSLLSLLIQGAFCYLFEYFAANYFLNSGYPMSTASGSAAPIGDMMIMTGDALFGQGHGRTFMLVEAITVFLALIGTTLSCMNTGARVTYAMGRDSEVPEHFGMLHAKNLSPHRAIWTLAIISAVIGCIAVSMAFGDAGAPTDAAIQALPHGIWSSFGYTTHDKMAALPNSLLTITLASNFGTFMLYMLELCHLHGRLPQPSELQRAAPFPHSLVRSPCELGLHDLLSDRAIHGVWHSKGTAAGFRNCRCLGDLWRDLLPSLQQGRRADDAGHQSYLVL